MLIAGGDDNGEDLAAAALFDPATGTFSPTGGMTIPPERFTATLLANGRVLVAGGINGDYTTSTADLYDERTGTFTHTGNMTVTRIDHLATLLPNGRVLITGGCNGFGFNCEQTWPAPSSTTRPAAPSQLRAR